MALCFCYLDMQNEVAFLNVSNTLTGEERYCSANRWNYSLYMLWPSMQMAFCIWFSYVFVLVLIGFIHITFTSHHITSYKSDTVDQNSEHTFTYKYKERFRWAQRNLFIYMNRRAHTMLCGCGSFEHWSQMKWTRGMNMINEKKEYEEKEREKETQIKSTTTECWTSAR